jgi:hypothetical protein
MTAGSGRGNIEEKKIIERFFCYACNIPVGGGKSSSDRAVMLVEDSKGNKEYQCGMERNDCSALKIFRMHSSHLHKVYGTRCYKDEHQEERPCETSEPTYERTDLRVFK